MPLQTYLVQYHNMHVMSCHYSITPSIHPSIHPRYGNEPRITPPNSYHNIVQYLHARSAGKWLHGSQDSTPHATSICSACMRKARWLGRDTRRTSNTWHVVSMQILHSILHCPTVVSNCSLQRPLPPVTISQQNGHHSRHLSIR
jgi:hypothetical protein